jgi:hypothetical protein
MPALLPDRLLKNITILVPNGTTQHGNERIVCLPITSHYWPSISAVIIFFAANFLAHAATVKSSPGDATHVQACNAFLALLFPMSGLLRALNAILRYSRVAKTELDKACNAGALCMVVRGRHWRPEGSSDLRIGVVRRFQEGEAEEDETKPISAELITYLPSYAREKPSRWVHFDSIWAQSYVDTGMKRIHGTFALPEGYTFAVVPRDTILISRSDTHHSKDATNDISASKSILKTVASMVQIASAFITLLSHRSDLINRWGYASYHLTVIPYLFMTLVNLVGNLCIADYPCLYMVRTATMDEAERSGGVFEGEVAQTITIENLGDDLVEELPYSGVTNEGIISFATSFATCFLLLTIFMQIGILLLIQYIVRILYHLVKPQIASDFESMVIDLHISGAAGDLHADQLSAVSTPVPIFLHEQIDPSSESDTYSSDCGEVECGIEIRADEECNCEGKREFRMVEPISSSRYYQIRILNPPQRPSFDDIWNQRRSAMYDMIQRSRRSDPSQYISDSSLSHVLKNPRQIIHALWDYDLFYNLFPERNFKPACLTTLYYPGCSRFLRTSSLNHHTMSHVRISLDDPPSAFASERRSRRTPRISQDPHTRWGVLLEIVVGLLLLGIFFSVIAVLTRFQPGHSSATERCIMMIWLASGLYGFCLPFMSTSELLRIFLLPPLVWILDLVLALRTKMKLRDRFIIVLELVCRIRPLMEAACSIIPLATFVPPIWGFVLVGRMLVEWGNCTRLY